MAVNCESKDTNESEMILCTHISSAAADTDTDTNSLSRIYDVAPTRRPTESEHEVMMNG